MKVTLINPPYPPNAHSHPPFIPLGLAYLGAVAEKAGHQVTVIDCQGERLNYDSFRQRVAGVPSDVIGVTSTTLLYNSAKTIMETAREVHPNAITMIGGSHVSFWDENALNETKALDVIVRKEGENTFLELLQRIEARKATQTYWAPQCAPKRASSATKTAPSCTIWIHCLPQPTTSCRWKATTAWAKPSSP